MTLLSNGTADDYDYLISIPESHLGLMQRYFDVRVGSLPVAYEKPDTTLLHFSRWPVAELFPNHELAERDRDRITPPRLATATPRLGHATVHTFYLRRRAFSTSGAFSRSTCRWFGTAIFPEHKKPPRKFGDPLWVMPCCSSFKIHAHSNKLPLAPLDPPPSFQRAPGR